MKIIVNNKAPRNLDKECHAGLNKRAVQRGIVKNKIPAYRKRMAMELEAIHRAGFSPFFFIASAIIKWAKENNVLVEPVLGNGAASMVSYCLAITDVDPVRHRLLFERFMDRVREDQGLFRVVVSSTHKQLVMDYLMSILRPEHNLTIRQVGGRIRLGIFDISFFKNLQTLEFKDIAACITLNWPLAHEKMLCNEYIERKNGTVQSLLASGTLQSILAETHGMMIYQEQLMRILAEVGGFTEERVRLARKKLLRFEQQEACILEIVAATIASGLPKYETLAMADLIKKYSATIRCKAYYTHMAWHAYQSAYLKAHYPTEFNHFWH